MTESAERPQSPWRGWVNLLVGAGLAFRYGSPMVGLLRGVHTGEISGRGLLIAGCFTTLNLILAAMTGATGLGQIGTRRWAPLLNAVTGGAVLMNAGFRLVFYGRTYEPDLHSLVLFGPDLVLAAWWLFGLRRGPWPPAMAAAAASLAANYGIHVWLSQSRY